MISEKLAIVSNMGAAAAVNSKTESLKDAGAAFAPDSFYVVVDAVGITPLFQQSLE